MLLIDSLKVNELGHLTFGGVDTIELAGKYGTPLYVMDENKYRDRCRTYLNAMKKYFGDDALPLYASKALSIKRIYEIAKEENIGTDVVSSGELYTAIKAGFSKENIYYHGNLKTYADVEYAICNGVGCFIVDHMDELEYIDEIAGKYGKKQKILLRLTPGIDLHTFKAVITGNVDSKFGFTMKTGEAEKAVKRVLQMKNVDFAGYHCHIGSQVFEIDPFLDSTDVIFDFIAMIDEKYGYYPREFNIGGGLGVRYTESDPAIDYDDCIRRISEHMKEKCKSLSIKMPRILMEPGRSMVADSGITLYSVGFIKEIEGLKNYVIVDGGMTDNPRYALYEAPYTAVVANKADKPADYNCTIAGRCCESGDLIQENIYIQKPEKGDILAVQVTGAYNYSMSSNYNRFPKPPIVMVNNGESYLAVKGETFEDIIRNDL